MITAFVIGPSDFVHQWMDYLVIGRQAIDNVID